MLVTHKCNEVRTYTQRCCERKISIKATSLVERPQYCSVSELLRQGTPSSSRLIALQANTVKQNTLKGAIKKFLQDQEYPKFLLSLTTNK